MFQDFRFPALRQVGRLRLEFLGQFLDLVLQAVALVLADLFVFLRLVGGLVRVATSRWRTIGAESISKDNH